MSQQQSTERNAASAAGERKRLLSYTELRELKGIPFSKFWILQLKRFPIILKHSPHASSNSRILEH